MAKKEDSNDDKKFSTDNKIAIISTLLTYASTESQIYWARNTVFFAINSAVIGYIAYNFTEVNTYLLFIASIAGIVFNKVWLSVMNYGKYLAEKWREDAREVIRSDESLINTYTSLLGNPRIKRPQTIPPSKVMKRLALSFLVIWILFLLYSGFDIIKTILEQLDKC